MSTSIMMVTKHAGINDMYLQKQIVNVNHTLNRFFSFCAPLSYPIKITRNIE